MPNAKQALGVSRLGPAVSRAKRLSAGTVLRQRLDTWASGWFRRRQGRDGLAVTLRRRRIYILPTRYGVIFGCLVFAMLLGSLNYAASLGYALTFLLLGLGLVALHHCHNNLLGIEVRCVGADPVFAGEDAAFRIALTNGAGATRYELDLGTSDRRAGPVDIAPAETTALALPVATKRRGWTALPRFFVATRHPGNLCRAWTYVHMDTRCLVYPTPAPPGLPAPTSAVAHGEHAATLRGDTDFAGLRNAVPGDSPRRIAWKAYARSEQLLLKEFSGGEDPARVFDLDGTPGAGIEERLSQLTRWCVDAAADGASFGLRLPTTTIGLGRGDKHLHACLAALALYEAPHNGREPVADGRSGLDAQSESAL